MTPNGEEPSTVKASTVKPGIAVDDLEDLWVTLAEATTRAGVRDRLFLAKLALLCAAEIGERATVERLIAAAERNL